MRRTFSWRDTLKPPLECRYSVEGVEYVGTWYRRKRLTIAVREV